MKKMIKIPVIIGVLALGGFAPVTGTSNNEAFANDLSKENPKAKTEEVVAANDLLSFEEAKAIAVKAVGGGKVTEIEIERERFGEKYEVEVKFDGFEYDLDINAKTGEVLRNKKESDDDKVRDFNEKNNKFESNSVSTNNRLTADQAVEIAMKQVKGTVTDVELDDDDGRAYYEIEIKDGRNEYEFEIDAATGEILEFEQDRDDD